jgi:hypothetical protein
MLFWISVYPQHKQRPILITRVGDPSGLMVLPASDVLPEVAFGRRR